ncbi:uncharacterized protein LY79DRAFT_357701 [Colletotrichum navitas]|uniref:Transmembrane protein n=1 Tax=Colletotrichum navitas TaxID=681940 RepID=A0AAD8PSC7_9PEZI|nr:uncharacterized protein LY79DRAFT_357701 [Colletotrichum navitas]KAK1579152.1 hypothetical protein LY79DRAFT_357701 [Colletotrichum navitas]
MGRKNDEKDGESHHPTSTLTWAAILHYSVVQYLDDKNPPAMPPTTTCPRNDHPRKRLQQRSCSCIGASLVRFAFVYPLFWFVSGHSTAASPIPAPCVSLIPSLCCLNLPVLACSRRRTRASGAKPNSGQASPFWSVFAAPTKLRRSVEESGGGLVPLVPSSVSLAVSLCLGLCFWVAGEGSLGSPAQVSPKPFRVLRRASCRGRNPIHVRVRRFLAVDVQSLYLPVRRRTVRIAPHRWCRV